MSLRETLKNQIQAFLLLDHPFYQKWTHGELSVDDLALYAREYGAFIHTIPKGWEALGEDETVAEETEHNRLWDEFAAALDTRVSTSTLREVEALLALSGDLFAQPATALGALYGFEIQQPETAASKLAGLRQFYNLGEQAERYFIEHANNHHEAEKLLDRIGALSHIEQDASLEACGRMSRALWDALSGVLAAL